MQIVKNGEPIGTVNITGRADATIEINLNRITTQELIKAVELSRQLACEDKAADNLIIKLSGSYPA